MWHPLSAIWGSIFFGALMILYLRLIIPFIPTQLYKILPYLVTVIVLVISSMRTTRKSSRPPLWPAIFPRGSLKKHKKNTATGEAGGCVFVSIRPRSGRKGGFGVRWRIWFSGSAAEF